MTIKEKIKYILMVNTHRILSENIYKTMTDQIMECCIHKNRHPYNINSKELRAYIKGWKETCKYYEPDNVAPTHIPLKEIESIIEMLEGNARDDIFETEVES